MGRVFISHATDDARWAEAACRALEEAGVTCWIAPRDLTAGEDWPTAIAMAVREATCVVVVHSRFTGGSATTLAEVREAHSRGKPVVVLCVDDAGFSDAMSLLVGGAHRLDATRPPREERLRDLVAAVSRAPEGAGGPRVRRGETPGHIGPYRLISMLGEGGFGEVWLAERREPHVQRVALKIIKPGMDTKAVIARFEQERQALAVMDHPHVAKVFDAGATEQGRPFFVMEYVDGDPITDYCDAHRLTLKERLELFVPVCEAVQHAHTKAIIHRDLKPSNILVATIDGKPAPKVIDFGVAKAISHTMTARTLYTEQGVLLGTPEYMSPEQASMGKVDVDTRSDVYSLGVVLYELLAGVPPFDEADLRRVGFDAMLRVIRESEAPKPSTRLSKLSGAAPGPDSASSSTPSTPPADPSPSAAPAHSASDLAAARKTDLDSLARTLKRELEWIPLKAMEKERSRRYDSPLDLAADVRAYLAGLPLKAAPPSAVYRLRKLARQYRGPIAAVGAVVAALVVGLAGTLWYAGEADKKTREAESQAYLANLIAADGALALHEPTRVRARLDACPEALRGWEWRWLEARSDTSLAVLRGHENGVISAALSRDGARVVTASWDKTARVWETGTGKELAVLRGHENGVISAAFSRDGARVVTASEDKTARMWEDGTGKELAVLRGHDDRVVSAAFSRDGARVVTASWDWTARVWEAGRGKELAVLLGHGGGVASAAFSPDGLLVVTASEDKTSRVWEAASGKEQAVLRGHEGMVQSAAFSPDGARVVTASWDNTARVWDTATGTELAVLRGHKSNLTSAVFSPDGACVVTASWDKTARVWDTATGAELAVLRGHENGVISAVFSPDGACVVTASWDKTARVWDTATGAELAVLRGHKSNLTSAVFSPDAARVVTASDDKTVRSWDYATGNELSVLVGITDWIRAAASSPDGARVVTVSLNRTARVWEAGSGKELAVLRGHEAGVNTAAFSPDGARVVTASEDKTARVWEAGSGKELAVLRGHEGWVQSAAFSPDGARVVTASSDMTARVWDAGSGKELAVLRGHESDVSSVAFSLDGTRVIAASYYGTARVWDIGTGKELVVVRGHEGPVQSVAFSPDGTRVVTASDDATARVWVAGTGKKLAVVRGHEGPVRSVAFSPDGTRVVTASDDATARVWEASSGKELAILRGHEGPVRSAAFSPDGTRIVTVSQDGTARYWDSIPHRIRLAERCAKSRGIEHPGYVERYIKETRGEEPVSYISDPSLPVPEEFFKEK